MKMKITWLNWLLWSAIVLVMGPNGALAAECSSDIKAVTNDDANVPVEILVHRVKPLTKCELEAEAQAWVLLLQKKVEEISTIEVEAIYKKEEIEQAEQAEEAKEGVQEAKEGADDAESKVESQKVKEETAELKTALIQHVTELTTEKTLLIDRFKVVLTELAAKGGETGEYDTYIQAVSGLKVDVTDASATWTTISGWLMSAEGGFRWALNLLQFIVIIVFYFLSIVAGKAANKAFSKTKNFSKLLREFLVLTARRLVLVVGLFVGLSALEINLGPILAVIGAAGFVIAFAL